MALLRARDGAALLLLPRSGGEGRLRRRRSGGGFSKRPRECPHSLDPTSTASRGEVDAVARGVELKRWPRIRPVPRSVVSPRLLAGVLYSLVALGFVLILQGLAACSTSRRASMQCCWPASRSYPLPLFDWPGRARAFSVWSAIMSWVCCSPAYIMAITASLVERHVAGFRSSRHQDRPASCSCVHHRQVCVHDRGRRPVFVRLRRLSAAAVSGRRLVPVRRQLPGRHPGQQDRRLGRSDRGRSGRGARAVLPADENRPRAPRRRRRSRRRPVGRHSARLDLVRRSGSWRASSRSSPRQCGGRSSAFSSRSRSWR